MKFNVQQQHEVEVTTAPDGSFLLNGKPVAADVLQKDGRHFHLIHKGRSYNIEVVEADFAAKTFHLKVNGQLMEVKGSTELDQLLARMGMNRGAKAHMNELKAPMPGAIIEVSVRPGDQVKKGDKLIVLEAMKMENVLKAQADGVVKNVIAKPGTSVEKNQLLIQFE